MTSSQNATFALIESVNALISSGSRVVRAIFITHGRKQEML